MPPSAKGAGVLLGGEAQPFSGTARPLSPSSLADSCVSAQQEWPAAIDPGDRGDLVTPAGVAWGADRALGSVSASELLHE